MKKFGVLAGDFWEPQKVEEMAFKWGISMRFPHPDPLQRRGIARNLKNMLF